jgi:hypothetical protein
MGRAEVAQLVEHRPEEAGVVSSILTLGTITRGVPANPRRNDLLASRGGADAPSSSWQDSGLWIREPRFESSRGSQREMSMATCPSGQGAVCKTVYTGSSPVVASTPSNAGVAEWQTRPV